MILAEQLRCLFGSLLPGALLESGLGLRDTQSRAPEIKITLGAVGNARFQVALGTQVVALIERTASQVAIRPRGMLLEPLFDSLFQGKPQASLQEFPSVLVLAEHVGSPDIIQRMDDCHDISQLLGQHNGPPPPSRWPRRWHQRAWRVAPCCCRPSLTRFQAARLRAPVRPGSRRLQPRLACPAPRPAGRASAMCAPPSPGAPAAARSAGRPGEPAGHLLPG